MVPFRSFFEVEPEVRGDLVLVEGGLHLGLQLHGAVDLEPHLHGLGPDEGWPPPWIGMHVTGAPVTKSITCLPRTSLKVTLWPLLVLPTYLIGLAAEAVAGRATRATRQRRAVVSFFM